MTTQRSLIERLHPRRFTSISPKMAAVVGYILNEEFTNPSIADILVTSDDFVLARLSGDIGFNEFLGHHKDLATNWQRLLHAAGLTPAQLQEAKRLYDEKIHKL